MYKTFKYRIYPTGAQKELIEKHIGSTRLIYNLALECKKTAHNEAQINLTKNNLTKQVTDLKKDVTWLKEVNAQSLQQSVKDLDNAYQLFFKKHNGYPKFKKKFNGGSFKIPQNVRINNGKLVIPKFLEGIKMLCHRNIEGNIKMASIKKLPTGKYYVYISCEVNSTITKSPLVFDEVVGIDLGIKSFLVKSNKESIDGSIFLKKKISKVKYLNRRISKYNGKRMSKKLTLLHERIVNQRRDFLHKTSTQLIKSHDSIAIEDLNVSEMIKGSFWASGISDASWGIFTNMLKYKAEWYGKNLLQIGRFEPSSKTCSSCGELNKKLTLNNRKWACACGAKHDRDINAAINIKNFAIKNYLSEGHRLKIKESCLNN